MDARLHNNWDEFEGIFNLHHQRVYVLCLRMTGNVREAEVLTEEVFVQVYRQLQSFPAEAAFSTCLYRLTVNRVLKYFRRSVVRKEQTSKANELPAEPVESSKRFKRAPVLSRSGGTSKSRLFKARMKLRQLLTHRITPRKIADVVRPDPENRD